MLSTDSNTRSACEVSNVYVVVSGCMRDVACRRFPCTISPLELSQMSSAINRLRLSWQANCTALVLPKSSSIQPGAAEINIHNGKQQY